MATKKATRNPIAPRKPEAPEATFGGLVPTFKVNVELGALSVASRRNLFAALIRDPEVVTAPQFTDEHIALWKSIEAACKWAGQ